jgi:hypothetical protein
MNKGTLSCGCLQRELLSLRAKPKFEVMLRTKLNDYKNGAKNRDYSWNLSTQEFRDLVTKECYFCGAQPNPFNGVDRFDNSKSYYISNCVPCCSICNRAKSTLTAQQFEEWIMDVYGHLFEGNI